MPCFQESRLSRLGERDRSGSVSQCAFLTRLQAGCCGRLPKLPSSQWERGRLPSLPRPLPGSHGQAPPLHSGQATCELAAFPSRQKGIFVSGIFLLKLQVTTLGFPKHSPLCWTRSRARFCFDFIHAPFLLSHPSREKLTIPTEHALVFPVFHEASVSQFKPQTPSATSPHSELSPGTCRDRPGCAEVWEPDGRGPSTLRLRTSPPPANRGSAVGSTTLQMYLCGHYLCEQLFCF